MGLLKEFSIQLYSLRELTGTKEGFFDVLKKLGEIGYTGVEFAGGYNEIPAKEMKKILDECKLKSIGTHTGLDKLTDRLDFELEYNKELGTEYFVCPGARMKTRDEVLRVAEQVDKIAEKCEEAGFKFAYHNHDFEFVKDGDEYLLDIFFNNTCKKRVFMELDLYWTAFAGVDEIAYMLQNENRVKLLHVKQILDKQSKKCVDLNEGVIDFKNIIEKALPIGVEHFILEQEEFAVSPYVSVKNGFDHIMSL